MPSLSQIIREAGSRAAKPKRKNPPQSKAALAAKFNARVEWFVKEGYDRAILPDIIEDPELFTHRELRQLVSAATAKKSSGVYQQGQYLLPEFRRSYAEAMVDIINDRRQKRSEMIKKIKPTVAGKPADVEERGRMGDIRARGLRPLKHERKFRSKTDEDFYIHNLGRMLDSERSTLYRDNMIVALRTRFGNKADKLIALLLKAKPDDAVKAYYTEELFDITTAYEQNENDTGYLQILYDTLSEISGIERANVTKKVRTYADQLQIRYQNRESVDIMKKLMM